MRSVVVVYLMAAGLAGCSPSISYSSGGARQVLTSPKEHGLVVADIMDGRSLGNPSSTPLFLGNQRSEDLAELRESAREHAINAGLASKDGRVVKAPESQEEAEAAMAEAAAQGAQLMLFTRLEGLFATGQRAAVVSVFDALNYLAALGIGFVGLLPSLIVYSLPINHEYAGVGVRAFLVDPRARLLLATFKESSVIDDEVSAWGLNPADELSGQMYLAMERLYRRVGAAIKDGVRAPAYAQPAATMLFSPQHAFPDESPPEASPQTVATVTGAVNHSVSPGDQP